MMPEGEGRKSFLGVAAYVLVPGERRLRAARHFQRAGLEALRGVAALSRPEPPPQGSPETRRERIEVE